MSQRNWPTPETRLCTYCGTELPANSPAGLCPRCVQQSAGTGTDGGPHPSIAKDPTLAPRATGSFAPVPGAGLRYFGDYEIIDEIARGGMGVVYKARQISLDRIVALKTILSGQLASEADVERFYTEARAAGNLQHPNIVAIHEVGQYGGQHYFSMDYVEGKSLSSLVENGPIPAAQAVAYVKAIAEAIHYAHQHGILHRDLKPSNILIDSFGEPRITDFGIAKRIGVREIPSVVSEKPSTDDSLTTAGQVLGTPSYMPPEQIDADPSQLCPASDVYAIGAILYELLTGRPPFRGRTTRDTLLAVLQYPPVSIKRLNRGVPRDLERICLKCLQKDPNRRYHSAGALADDLERFTLGEQTCAAADAKALAPRILIGSLLAFFLFCCGGPLIVLEWFPHKLGFGERLSEGLGTMFEQIRSSIHSSLQLQDLMRTWHPPIGSALGSLFPDRIGPFSLSAHDENAVIPEFRIDLPGSRATYKSGPATVECFVYRANQAEAARIFARVQASFNDESVRVDTSRYAHYGYKFAGRTRNGTFLRTSNWLLLARTTDDADLDGFLRAFLTATSSAAPSTSLADDDAAAEEEGESSASTPQISSPVRSVAATLIGLAVVVAVCTGAWKAYSKAGLPGWGCLIPFYNLVLLMRLGGKPGWWAIWLFVPFLNFVIYTIVTLEVAKNFGKGVAYMLGLLLFPPLFYAILGLGNAQYNATLRRLRQQAAVV
jgi:serine/threonine protein kinase